MLDSIYLSWDVQIVLIDYGFNDNWNMKRNTNRLEFYRDLLSKR